MQNKLIITDFAGLRSIRVKPLGTITMSFSYVDEETRAILQSIMDNAENYADFTEKLCDKVLVESTPTLLQFFAFFFAWYSNQYRLLEKLVEANKLSDLASPLRLIYEIRKGEVVDWNDMKASIKKALDAAPNDWIATLIYLVWRWFAEFLYPEADVDVRPIELIEKSVNENEEFEYFGVHLQGQKAHRLRREANFEEANNAISQSIALARKFDDLVEVASLLIIKANIVKHTDPKRAIEDLFTSRDLCKQLGHRSGLSSVLWELGHILAFRGEFDAAIDCQLESFSLKESLGLHEPNLYPTVAALYNMKGDGNRALKYAKIGIEQINATAPLTRNVPFRHTAMAWALITLGRNDEAKKELEKSKKLVTKTGDSLTLIYSQIVEGLFEKAENNHDCASQIFEEILKWQEESPLPLYQNICLLNLVDIEIERLSQESIGLNSDSSGPWMEKLDEYIQKNDLPGIAAQSLLLKAKLRNRQGRFDEVRKILKEVQTIAEAPSMRYLNDLAVSMFPDIIVT